MLCLPQTLALLLSNKHNLSEVCKTVTLEIQCLAAGLAYLLGKFNLPSDGKVLFLQKYNFDIVMIGT